MKQLNIEPLIKPIRELKYCDSAVIYGRLHKLSTRKAFRRRTPIAEGTIEDASGKLKIIWFHQPYLAKMLPEKINQMSLSASE